MKKYIKNKINESVAAVTHTHTHTQVILKK